MASGGAPTTSLFIATGDPVLQSSVDWISGILLGSVAIGLCVIAVAIVGLMLLSGRLAFREGFRVVLGCFVLLGAPVIASAFTGAWQNAPQPATVFIAEPSPPANPRADLPPADYDPYAGASLRRD